MFCTKQKVQQATRHTGQSNATLREILNRIVAKVKKTWNAIEDNLRTTITSWNCPPSTSRSITPPSLGSATTKSELFSLHVYS